MHKKLYMLIIFKLYIASQPDYLHFPALLVV